MIENPLNVLQTSKDSKELLKAALVLARSKESRDHAALLEYLRRADFLNRLDSAEEYGNAAAKRLRISRVIEALSMNDAPSAHSTFTALTRDAVFLKADQRIDELIRFSAGIRSTPEALVSFWDKYSQPDDGFSNLTIKALIENGTAPAMEVLEQKMADPRHEEEEKIGWMRGFFVAHRDDLFLLRSVEKMLQGKLPVQLRPHLVEVIFDYKPEEWYRPATIVNPPDRRKADQRVREQLRRLGQIALQLPNLTDAQKSAVKKTLNELNLENEKGE